MRKPGEENGIDEDSKPIDINFAHINTGFEINVFGEYYNRFTDQTKQTIDRLSRKMKEEWKEGAPELLEMTPENLNDFIRWMEATYEMAEMKTQDRAEKYIPYVPYLGSFSNLENTVLNGLIILKKILEGKNAGEVPNEKIKEQMLKIFETHQHSRDEFTYLLLRIGQEGPKEYAPIVSQILYLTSTVGPAIADYARFSRYKNNQEQIHSTKEKFRRETATIRPEHGVTDPAHMLLITLMNTPEHQKKTWNQYLDGLIEKIAEACLHHLEQFTNYSDPDQSKQEVIENLTIPAISIIIRVKDEMEAWAQRAPETRRFIGNSKFTSDEFKERVFQAIEKQSGGKFTTTRYEETLKTIEQKTHPRSAIVHRTVHLISKHLASLYTTKGDKQLKSIEEFTKQQLDTDSDKDSIHMELANNPVFQRLLTLQLEGTHQNGKDTMEMAQKIIPHCDTAGLIFLANAITINKRGLFKPLLEDIFNALASKNSLISIIAKENQLIGLNAIMEIMKTLLTPERMQKTPQLAEEIVEQLINPNYITFIPVCTIACGAITAESAKGQFTNHFVNSLFTTEADFTNPIRIAALRETALLLSDEDQKSLARALFENHYENIAKNIEALGVALGPFMQKLVLIGAQIVKETKKTERKEQEQENKQNAAIPYIFLKDLSNSPICNNFQPHALQDIISDIILHRSIHISHDGHDVNLETVESPLTENLNTARVKRNKDTGNPPESLACNVSLYHKGWHNSSIPCRLLQNGEMEIRILNEHGTEKETINRTNCHNYQISEKVFDELHFLILEAIKIIYVRKPENTEKEQTKPETPVVPVEPAPPETPDLPPKPSPDGDNKNQGTTTVWGLPPTIEREDGSMTIDLTDREKRIRKTRDAKDKIYIQSNKARVMEVFISLKNGSPMDETPPANAAEMILYKKIRVNGTDVYEQCPDPIKIYHEIRNGLLSPEDIYIRTGRAFATPLPYVKKVTQTRDEPPKPFFIVESKNRSGNAEFKREIFQDEQHGEALAIGDMQKFLEFQVGDNPFAIKLLEQMKNPEFIRQLTQARIAELDERLRDKKEEIWEQQTSRPQILGDKSHFEQSTLRSQYAEEEANAAKKEIEELLRETSEKARVMEDVVADTSSETGTRIRRKIILPQAGFKFQQTFNHGKFKSLKDLLKISATIATGTSTNTAQLKE